MIWRKLKPDKGAGEGWGKLDIWGVTKGPPDRTFDQSTAQGALGMEGGWGERVPGGGISRSKVPEVGAGKGH